MCALATTRRCRRHLQMATMTLRSSSSSTAPCCRPSRWVRSTRKTCRELNRHISGFLPLCNAMLCITAVSLPCHRRNAACVAVSSTGSIEKCTLPLCDPSPKVSLLPCASTPPALRVMSGPKDLDDLNISLQGGFGAPVSTLLPRPPSAAALLARQAPGRPASGPWDAVPAPAVLVLHCGGGATQLAARRRLGAFPLPRVLPFGGHTPRAQRLSVYTP